MQEGYGPQPEFPAFRGRKYPGFGPAFLSEIAGGSTLITLPA